MSQQLPGASSVNYGGWQKQDMQLAKNKKVKAVKRPPSGRQQQENNGDIENLGLGINGQSMQAASKPNLGKGGTLKSAIQGYNV